MLAHDEDPESLAGDVIPDPWDDPNQPDWPDNPTPAEPPPDGGS